LEFAILFILLLWIIRRVPTPWVYDMHTRRILTQLNRIEAYTRGVPVEEIEQEFSDYLANGTAAHDGSPLFSRMWR
jgi:hypothetical protein